MPNDEKELFWAHLSVQKIYKLQSIQYLVIIRVAKQALGSIQSVGSHLRHATAWNECFDKAHGYDQDRVVRADSPAVQFSLASKLLARIATWNCRTSQKGGRLLIQLK